MELAIGMRVRVRTFSELHSLDGYFVGTIVRIGSKQNPDDGTRHIAMVLPEVQAVSDFIGGRGEYALGAAHWDIMVTVIP